MGLEPKLRMGKELPAYQKQNQNRWGAEGEGTNDFRIIALENYRLRITASDQPPLTNRLRPTASDQPLLTNRLRPTASDQRLPTASH